jgi:hypothetical protein
MPVGIKLKDCPFCGAKGSNGDLLYDTELTINGPMGFVECLICPAIIRAKNVGAAVRRWNRRANLSEGGVNVPPTPQDEKCLCASCNERRGIGYCSLKYPQVQKCNDYEKRTGLRALPGPLYAIVKGFYMSRRDVSRVKPCNLLDIPDRGKGHKVSTGQVAQKLWKPFTKRITGKA